MSRLPDRPACYERLPGILVEAVDQDWAAFSPGSGETILLNNESVALLEVLAEGSATADTVYQRLAEDTDIPVEELATILSTAWPLLLDAGLIRIRNGDV